MTSATATDPSPLRYRPDIDGLRTLAVVPVVLFHAGFTAFSGGYVGVDIFFVISGYLITGIILREVAAGRYSTMEFYRRRARRIFPALAFMTLCVLAAGYLFFTPAEFVDLAKSAGALSVFGSNFYFWRSVGYFEMGSAVQPLLHTWSLAVEEQYYIFFPLLILLFHANRKRLVTLLWVIAILSFVLAVIFVPWKPRVAFYLLPTRAWELMVGGLLAAQVIPAIASQRGRLIAGLAGLAMIGWSILALDAATPFPGFAALPSVLGAALLIMAGDQRGSAVTRGLSWRPMVALGQASYSFYLWHVPLFEFGKYLTGGALSTGLAIGLTLASVVMAFVSLHFVERPFRTGGDTPKARRLALGGALAMVVVGLLSLSILALRGVPGRLDPQAAALVAVAEDKNVHHGECMSVDPRTVAPEQACRLGDARTAPSVLLWGDSHSVVTATAMEQAARRHQASFLFAADADCPVGIGFSIDPSVDPGLSQQSHYRFCGDYNRRMLALALARPELATIVLSARWSNWRIGEPGNPTEAPADVRLRDAGGMADGVAANAAIFERGFGALVKALLAAGKTVVIVGPLPEPPVDVTHQLHIERFGLATPVTAIPEAEYRRRHARILGMFAALPANPKLVFVWPASRLCGGGSCPVVEDGHPMFFDHNHLSVHAATKTSPLYDPLFAAARR